MRQAQRLAVDDGGRVGERADLRQVEEEAGIEFLLVGLEELAHPLAGDLPAAVDDDRVGEMHARAVPFLDGLVLHREGAVDDREDAGHAPDGVGLHRTDRAVQRFHLVDDVEGAVRHEDRGVFVAGRRDDRVAVLEFPGVGGDAAFADLAEHAHLAAFGPGVGDQFGRDGGAA
ncbi:MAG: hypothetical protein EBR95_06445 [Verrucomicrobia bacterium]|nr:hypothetical protein [Verrucomicrobiota bacterium]